MTSTAGPRAVPPAVAAVFGRPSGVRGSFETASYTAAGRRSGGLEPVVAPPDPILAEAFGRPPGTAESLPRDPHARFGEEAEAEPESPWRDPEAPALLGAPAVVRALETAVPPPAAKLTAGEVFFGRRITWQAYVILGAAALVVALVGGLMGRMTAEVVEPLHSDNVTLAAPAPGEAPATDVERVAAEAARSVVTIYVATSSSLETGSGSVIDERGYVLTNNHVVERAATNPDAKLTLRFVDGTERPWRLVGRDPTSDIAVVKVDGVDNLKVATFGDSDALKVGQRVVAIGAPRGLTTTVTSGIVSAVRRAVIGPTENPGDVPAVLDAVQTDAAVNPGNSGGPLLDAEARIIGVNTLAKTTSGGTQGLNFAVPANWARSVAESLIRDGRITHPTIGVTARDVTNDTVRGAAIADVKKDSPGERAGLREGDVVVKFGSRDVADAAELMVAVRTSKADAESDVEYIRDGRRLTTKITPRSE